MIKQLKYSAVLLIILGLLFSIPIAAKTWSAHGAAPAIATGLLVIFSVFIGPISFAVAAAIDTDFVDTTSATSGTEAIVVSILGLVLVFAWLRSLARGTELTAAYLPVTGWALMGAYFCVSLVFTHAT